MTIHIDSIHDILLKLWALSIDNGDGILSPEDIHNDEQSYRQLGVAVPRENKDIIYPALRKLLDQDALEETQREAIQADIRRTYPAYSAAACYTSHVGINLQDLESATGPYFPYALAAEMLAANCSFQETNALLSTTNIQVFPLPGAEQEDITIGFSENPLIRGIKRIIIDDHEIAIALIPHDPFFVPNALMPDGALYWSVHHYDGGVSQLEFMRITATDGAMKLYSTRYDRQAHALVKTDVLRHNPEIQDRTSITPQTMPHEDFWFDNFYADDLGENASVTIALIDFSGVDYNHPMLAHRLARNEADPIDGNDNDDNGYKDDYLGWDFAENDNRPYDLLQTAFPQANGDAIFWHGTSVAGVAIFGSQRIRVLPLVIGELDDLPKAVAYAASRGARLVNFSFAFRANKTRETFEHVVKSHPELLFTAAAGNTKTPEESPDLHDIPEFPAALNAPNLLTATACDKHGALSYFSKYGKGIVDLCAPGEDLPSLQEGGRLGSFSGTSYSAPATANVAAKMLLLNPQLSPAQIANILRTTSEERDRFDEIMEGGILSPEGAIDAARAGKRTEGIALK